MLEYIVSPEHFEQVLQAAGGDLVVVDFFADWCGPCRMIAPVFEELAATHSHITFCKVNGDDNQILTKMHGVNGYPCFIFFRRGKEIERMMGADAKRLTSLTESLGNSSGTPLRNTSRATNVHSPAGNSLAGGLPSIPPGTGRNFLAGRTFSSNSNSPSGNQLSSAPSAFMTEEEMIAKAVAESLKEFNPVSSSDVPMTVVDSNYMDEDEETRQAIAISLLSQESVVPVSTSITPASNKSPMTKSESVDEEAMTAEKMGNDAAVAAGQTEADIQQLLPVANSQELSKLIGRGFPEVRAIKGLIMTGNKNADDAQDWIFEHMEDADIDEPLTVVGFKKTSKLSFEEQKALLEERVKKARFKRLEKEKLDEREREKNRIEGGKALQKTKVELQQQQRRHEMDALAREKEFDKREKERLRKQNELVRAERAAKYAPAGTSTAPADKVTEKSFVVPMATTKTEYTDCKVAVKMPSGETLEATFPVSTTIQDVHFHFARLVPSTLSFALSQRYPRVVYEGDLIFQSLQQAGLVPMCSLIAIKR